MEALPSPKSGTWKKMACPGQAATQSLQPTHFSALNSGRLLRVDLTMAQVLQTVAQGLQGISWQHSRRANPRDG